MCLKANHPVEAYNNPCSTCPDYLNSCMPVIIGGFVFGECDFCYCEFCNCYEECMSARFDTSYQTERGKELRSYEVNEL